MSKPDTQPSDRVVWEPSHLGAFIRHVRSDRFFALWMLAATTGVSFDRIVSLERPDVDLEARRFNPAGATSAAVDTRRGPSYLLEPDTYDAVREHVTNWEHERRLLAHGGPRLFVWSNGEPLDAGSAMTMFEQHCGNAGVPIVTINDMRLAYVLAALESGIPTRAFRDPLLRGPQTPPATSVVSRQDPTPRRRTPVTVGRSTHRAPQKGAGHQSERALRGRSS